MSHPDPSSSPVSLPDDLAAIAHSVGVAAEARRDDSLALLALLRLLEHLHRDIRETLFQNALPDNRQALYALLRDIEINGGWPYINRMKVKTLIRYLVPELSEPHPEPTGEPTADAVIESDGSRYSGQSAD